MRPIDGLIPAHAGKTVAASAGEVDYWAHPRSRGENYDLIHCISEGGGSSPLTRGKLARTGQVRRAPGLIPAHAGKTGS